MSRRAALVLLVVPLAAACGPAATPDFYASRPGFERPLPAQRVPEGLQGLSARECGGCHVEIYREWQQSVHAQSWSDLQFQAEIRRRPRVRWMCVNCHTPLRNQIDSLVVALQGGEVDRPVRHANGVFDVALRAEGVTCASCHVRDGVVEGPFADARAPHAVRYNPMFRSADLCLGCHESVQAYPGKNFVCTFQTGEEWRQSPHAAAGHLCQDCHMPAVDRALVAGGMVRRGRRHGWIGSHLPKGGETLPALWDSLAALVPPGVVLIADRAPTARAGDSTAWTVRAMNASAGHRLPTGDPYRVVFVHLEVVTDAGDTLARAEHVIARRDPPRPEVNPHADNRLALSESMVLSLGYRVPRGGYRLVARAVNQRISDPNADHRRLPASYPRRVEVARVERRASRAE